jgi:hypothetical protein
MIIRVGGGISGMRKELNSRCLLDKTSLQLTLPGNVYADCLYSSRIPTPRPRHRAELLGKQQAVVSTWPQHSLCQGNIRIYTTENISHGVTSEQI